MCNTRALGLLLVSALVVLHCGVIAQVSAQGSNATSRWQTLTGDPPFVVARGGFSGIFPDSSSVAYSLTLITSAPSVILWCDVQLTKDEAGICFPDLKLDNASNIAQVFKTQQKNYLVNGVPTPGWFSIDYTLNDLSNIILNQGVYSRTDKFDGNVFQILTVQDMARQIKPPGLWLNIQHDAFYAQHNLSMRSFVLSVSRSVVVNYISSPEVNFLRSIAARFRPSMTKLVFRFLGKSEIEPTTNQTYGSLLKNLTFIKTFASGILVPKDYIWPVDESLYLLPHTTIVLDAHKERLEVFASNFANDIPISFNYSHDPLTEYLSFIDNRDFSVDGVLSDFPLTPSAAVDCFAHLGKNASKSANLLVISKNGASGDYPSCTNLAYQKAISDGVDFIDCPVQMSKDGVPFCLSFINLINSTNAAQSKFNSITTTIPDIMAGSGIFSFSLNWDEIQTLIPQISNPYFKFKLFRNPKNKNAGKFMKLSDFLEMAKNANSLSGVLISIENAVYLAEKQGMSVTNSVMEALGNAGYNKQTALKVMIQSTDSSVLMKLREKTSYELVYKVKENIRDALNQTIEDIKKFADSVVLSKESVYPLNSAFITSATDIVQRLQSFKLPVYVETFSNEFVSQAWDFFSDPTVEINTYYEGAGIDGVITEFPMTAARYRRNRCLKRGDKTPPYMNPVQPGGLLPLITSDYLPPAEAPNPILTEAAVTEPPLPPVTPVPSTSPSDGSDGSAAPATPPNGQPKVATGIFLSTMAMLLITLLLL